MIGPTLTSELHGSMGNLNPGLLANKTGSCVLKCKICSFIDDVETRWILSMQKDTILIKSSLL